MTADRRWLGLLVAAACGGGDEVAITADTGSTAPVDTGGASSSSDGAASDAGSTAAPDTGDSTGAPTTCGDGTREGLEQCDDGNLVADDGCEPDCTLPSGGEIWTTTVDGGDDDSIAGIAIVADGSIVAIGSQRGDDGLRDTWIARFDPEGSAQDDRVVDLGDGGHDGATELAILDDGAIAVVGTSTKPSDVDDDDAFVAVIDADGEVRWRDVVDGGMVDAGFDLALGPAGLVAVGSTQAMATRADAWIRSYDLTGAIAIDVVDDGSGLADAAMAVAWTDDDGLVVGGYVGTGADQDAWLSRRDGSGDERWHHELDFDFGDDFVADIAIVAGTIWITGQAASALTNSEELWVASWSDDGTMGDALTWNSDGFDVDLGNALVVDGTRIFVAGVSAVAEQQRNVLVARFDAGTPTPSWLDVVDGGAGLGDAANAIARLPDGSVIAGGEVTVLGQGTDAWLRRYAP